MKLLNTMLLMSKADLDLGCPLCFLFVYYFVFMLFIVVSSVKPKQNQGRGLVDRKLVQAPPPRWPPASLTLNMYFHLFLY